MVLIHLKRSEDQQFLFEAACAQSVDAVIRDLVAIHNLRLRISRLKLEGEELALYGRAKRPEEQGLDEVEDSVSTSGTKDRGTFYKADPTGRRTGEACDPEVAKVLTRTLADAEAAASKNQVAMKVPLTIKMLEEAIQNVKGAVMICYPMGLPDYDPVRQALEDKEELAGSSHSLEVLDPETAQLWWAGKQLLRENKLGDHVGRNEKTKIVAKLQKPGSGAPARESPVDAETQKAMMAWYHKKQQEQKALQEDDDDSYSNSAWANPKALKGAFSGVGQIKFR